MTNKKALEKKQTFKKINDILNSSKLKVIHLLKSAREEASHNMMIALLSRNTFEHAEKEHGFTSDLYKNDFTTKANINIIFLQEKITLSNTYEKTIKSFLNHKTNDDKNYIVANFKINDPRLKDFKVIDENHLNALAHEITISYASKKYKQVIVYSNIAANKEYEVVLPMQKLNIPSDFQYQNLQNNTFSFFPSLQEVIRLSFRDYTKGLISYFYFNSKYTELKNVLVKYEGSISNVEEKIEEITKTINKIRQNKITEEIILANEWESYV